jgi:acyl-CoA synthetase (AMP-forming)/AMP-acid ligase II
VAAAIVSQPDAAIDEARVVEVCRSQLASYKKPTSVMFLEALPVNAARKVDKRELSRRFGGNAGSGGN